MLPQCFFDLACDFYFFLSHLHHLSMCIFLIFLLTVNHPTSPSLSPFSLDHSSTSLQYRPSYPISSSPPPSSV